MSADYSGLTRNTWPGTWSPSSNAPIALDTELRGSLRTISGATGDRLTDIPGQRLQDGMLVYVQTGYASGGNTYTSGVIYQFKNSGTRDSSGNLSNADSNWSSFGSTQVNADWNATTGVSSIANKPSIPVLLCPFDPRSSLSFSYDGSGNLTTLTYAYGGATQGYADFAYSSGNLSTITYTGPDHTTVLRTITFSYSGTNISGYTVA